jgi:colanic acid/amylovoran biosynthesis protein
MKATQVLFVSYHSSLNNGDRALLEVNMRQMRNALVPSQLTLAAGWPYEPYFNQATLFKVIPSAWQLIGVTDKTSPWLQIIKTFHAVLMANLYQKGLRRSIPSNWLQLFKTYEQADIIASVSSTHFYSTGRFGWPFPLKIFMVDLAHQFKKPFYVMPQSIGPLRWEWERMMLRSVYERARFVCLRDQASMRLAESIHLPKEKVRFTADPAFAFPAADKAIAIELLNRYNFTNKKPAVGMTLIPWQGRWVSHDKMVQYFRNLADSLTSFHQETNAQIYLFNQVTGPTKLDDDRVAAKMLLEQIGADAKWITYVNEILPPDTLKACYGCMDLFIASRLHSGIFALAMNIPVVFIGYMAKTRGMMESLGFEDWVVDLNQMTGENLLEKIRLAWQEREIRRERILSSIPKVINQVDEVSEWIRQDYAIIKS